MVNGVVPVHQAIITQVNKEIKNKSVGVDLFTVNDWDLKLRKKLLEELDEMNFPEDSDKKFIIKAVISFLHDEVMKNHFALSNKNKELIIQNDELHKQQSHYQYLSDQSQNLFNQVDSIRTEIYSRMDNINNEINEINNTLKEIRRKLDT